MSRGRPPDLPAEERWIIRLLFGLAAAPAWLRGGTHAPWTAPLLWVALVLLLALVVWLAWRRARRAGAPAALPVLRARDPVFWLGLSFLLLLAAQWWNAGRMLYFDTAAREWAYSAPRVAWLPSAITPGEARQMLDWFVPAWIILVVLRSPAVSGRAIRMLWRLMAYQAALLALFGIVQYATGTTRMYGFVPMRPHFFASFGYPNHAGSYFLMTMCLAAGLLSHGLAPEGGSQRWPRSAALGIAFLLSLVGANLSLSRLAIIMSWVLALSLCAYLVRFFWPRLSASARVNAISAALAVLCLAAVLTVGLGREGIRREFKPEAGRQTLVQRETSFRWFQVQSAVRMWRDHPWFGVGGWGYRYLLAHYLPPEQWRRITEGKANVHNDPAQFLVEFGAIGGGAMAAVVVLLAWSAHRAGPLRRPLLLFPLVGAGLVGLQSLIDLPFRSPAVMYVWLICLAGASRALPPRRVPARPAEGGASQLNVLSRADMIRAQE